MSARFLFSCGKCGFTGSEDIDRPHPYCPKCKIPLKNTGMLKEDWDQCSNEQKDALRKRWWDEQKRDLEGLKENRMNFKCTTGYNFEGFQIKEYKDIVSGEVVLGTGFLSEIGADIKDLFGKNAKGFEGKIAQAKTEALYSIKEKALRLGANALIGIDFDIMTIGANMIVVSANGTAVFIQRQNVSGS